MDPTFLSLAIIILLFSVILHEVMHGVAALYFGDDTAEKAGRLTLNPIPHIDPVGTILLPLILVISGSPVLFGWAKPVPVNPLKFSNIRKGELATSAAGVLSNFALAFIGAGLIRIFSSSIDTLLANILLFTVNINLILAIFNLLPIPPLDGSKILMSFLSPKMELAYRELERYGFVILLMLWFIPFGNTSILGAILSFFLNTFHSILGL